MSYFATLTPLRNGPFAPTSPTLSQDPAINTISKHLFAVVTASIDFRNTGTFLFFTTATDRGRFFPTQVVVVAEHVSGSGGSPSLDIGKTSPNYNEWVNTTLSTPLYTAYGSGQYEFVNIQDVTATTSAAPGTDVYYKIDTASTANFFDTRSVILMGFYTGT